MNDPWKRGTPPIAIWSYADFQEAWYYFEPESPRTNPYFGVAIVPWAIEAWTSVNEDNSVTISAEILYTCPYPFNCSMFPSNNVLATLFFNFTEITLNPSYESSIELGNLEGGETALVSWIVDCFGSCKGLQVTVRATGIVSNTEVATFCCNSTLSTPVNYPQYSYNDMIGGETTFFLA